MRNRNRISNHLQQSDLPDSMISRMKGNCSRDRHSRGGTRYQMFAIGTITKESSISRDVLSVQLFRNYLEHRVRNVGRTN